MPANNLFIVPFDVVRAMAALISLEAAVRDKYCCNGGDEDLQTLPAHKTIKESALGYRPGACPVQRRTSIVLDHSGVTHVGSREELGSLCPQVEELQLAANTISQWEDVYTILSTLSHVSLLDLSQNPLSTPPPPPPRLHCLTLQTLALNGTDVAWSAVQLCLEMLPCLQELHLSQNGYSEIALVPSFVHPALKKLHINNNQLSNWREIEKLSTAFPSLTSVVATSNPLVDIPPVREGVFPELRSLNLNKAALANWTAVEHLSALSSLTDLSLLRLPLGAELDERKRRYAVIARMPRLKKLNKSEVTESEREDAERWVIRQHENDQNPPAVYKSLVQKHGILDKLAEVDLSPKKEASLEFHFEDRDTEVHRIKLYQTTSQLKRWLGKHIGMPPSTFRLAYLDQEYTGLEVMIYNSKYLDTYQMKDGDQIHVLMK